MDGLNDLLNTGNVSELRLTFDHSDRESPDRVGERDLPEGFGIKTVHIGENGTVFLTVVRQD